MSNEGPIVPKYYYVPEEAVEDERAKPGSQELLPSDEGYDGTVFLWGQSVYLISQLLVEGLLHINELDPIRRYLPAADRPKPSSRYSSFQRAGHDDTTDKQSSPSDLVVQVVLIAESVRLQQMLATYGIKTQTPHQIEPIEIWPPSELSKAYEQLGVNKKLNLTGRPPRPFGGLGTSKIYRACGYTFICYPLLFEVTDFYLSQDMQFVLDDVKSDLAFLAKCWKLAGRPTFCMVIREDNMRGPNARYIFDLLAQFKRGDCDGVKIRIGRLQEFISTACIEHLDFLTISPEQGQHFRKFPEKEMGKSFRSLTDIPKIVQAVEKAKWVSEEELLNKSTWDLKEMYNHVDTLYSQAQIMKVLMDREGRYLRVNDVTVEDHIDGLYRSAGSLKLWSVVRYCAALLGKVVDSLAPSMTAILVRGKQVTLGVYGHEEEVIDKPMSPSEIKAFIYNKCYRYDISQAVLQQELLINMGRFMSTKPEYFRGILKIRIGWVIQAMRLELSYSEEKETNLYTLSPSAIKKLLLQILTKAPHGKDHRSPIWKRQLDGALNRVPKEFYDKVWRILNKTPGGLRVCGYHLPQQPTLSDMTEYELNFSLLVEQMLIKIVDPAYRQMVVETFMVVSTLLDRNPEVTFQKAVDIDKLVQEAFEMFQKDQSELGIEKADDMNSFYNTPQNIKKGTTSYLARAVVNNLLEGDIQRAQQEMCSIS